MSKSEYKPHQFSVIETANQLAMFAHGSGDCNDSLLLRQWLEWRITDGWAVGNPAHESYDRAVKNLAIEALLSYKNSWANTI